MKKRFSEEQILGFLREADAGLPIKRLQRGLLLPVAQQVRRDEVPDAKRLKELETENTRLKKLLAEQMLENEVIRDVLRKKP